MLNSDNIFKSVFENINWYGCWYKSFFINHTKFLSFIEKLIRPLGHMDSYLPFQTQLAAISSRASPALSDVVRGTAPPARFCLCPTWITILCAFSPIWLSQENELSFNHLCIFHKHNSWPIRNKFIYCLKIIKRTKSLRGKGIQH